MEWKDANILSLGKHDFFEPVRFDGTADSVYVGERKGVVVSDSTLGGELMDNLKKLIEAFAGCGEAAAIYKGQSFIHANDLFAQIFERETSEFEGLPIIDVCHNDSIEMIRDFMHRRAIENHGVPTNYTSAFITSNQEKIHLNVIAIRMKKADDNILLIVKKA